MSFVKSLVLLLSLSALTSTTLATPHIPRSAHHRAIVARGVSPNIHAIDTPALPVKRTLRKRCKPRPSQSSEAGHASTAVANVGGDPSTSTKEDHQDAAATTHKAAATTKTAEDSKPSPTKDSNSNPNKGGGGGGNLPSFMGGTNTGEGTFYGTGLGACGETNSDTDMIAAVSLDLFDNFPGYNHANPNTNPLCGQKVKASYKGKSVVVRITDRCVGCAKPDLDFSPAAFNKLADPAEGRIFGLTWEWTN